MMISMKEMAELATRKGMVIGAFYAFNLEQAQGIILAGVEEQVPVIIAVDEPGAVYAGARAFIALVKELGAEVPLPVSVVLDRAHDPDLIITCVAAGCSGIQLDFREDGPERLGEIVVDRLKDVFADRDTFLEVCFPVSSEQSAESIQRSLKSICELNVHSVCISVTGQDRTAPKPELLANIKKIITSLDVQASIAGISRWPDQEIKSIIKSGVWKASFSTRLNIAFTAGLKTSLETKPDRINPRSYLAPAREAYTKAVKECLRLLVSS